MNCYKAPEFSALYTYTKTDNYVYVCIYTYMGEWIYSFSEFWCSKTANPNIRSWGSGVATSTFSRREYWEAGCTLGHCHSNFRIRLATGDANPSPCSPSVIAILTRALLSHPGTSPPWSHKSGPSSFGESYRLLYYMQWLMLPYFLWILLHNPHK